jgi:hypothetical protein
MAHVTRSRHEVLVSALGDPIQATRVAVRFTDIVRDSFLEDARLARPMGRTQHEVARRTGILYDRFMTLLRECGYSTTHALDVLPKALRATLDGVDWTPAPADRAWTVDDKGE